MSLDRLSPALRRVLATVRLQADITFLQVSKITGIKPHAVQYAMAQAIERQIATKWYLINFFAIGLHQYQILFSLNPSGQKERMIFLKRMNSSTAVIWRGELNGDFQYAVSILAHTPYEAAKVFDAFSQGLSAIVIKRSVSNILSFSLLAKKYLWHSRDKQIPLSLSIKYPSSTNIMEIDDLDKKLLSCINLHPSNAALAKALQIPRTTADLRIKKLRDLGVIAGQVYLISAAKLKMQTARLLITLRASDVAARSAIEKFMLYHLNVVAFAETYGAWDYEMNIETSTNHELRETIEQFYVECGSFIQETKLVSILEQKAPSVTL